MSDRAALNLGILIVIGMIIQLAVIGYVFYTDYEGRVNAVIATRAGCERDKLDRSASVTLNTNILIAFENSDKKRFKTPPDPERKKALAKIDATTAGLRDRARINCNKRYPDASLLP